MKKDFSISNQDQFWCRSLSWDAGGRRRSLKTRSKVSTTKIL